MAWTHPQLRLRRAIAHKHWTCQGMEPFLLGKALRKPVRDPQSVLATWDNADVVCWNDNWTKA